MIFLYLFGIVCGVLYAVLLKHTRFHGEPVPFVMELPNYRLPSAASVLRLMWEKAKDGSCGSRWTRLHFCQTASLAHAVGAGVFVLESPVHGVVYCHPIPPPACVNLPPAA